MGALGGWMGARTPHLQTAALGGRLGTVTTPSGGAAGCPGSGGALPLGCRSLQPRGGITPARLPSAQVCSAAQDLTAAANLQQFSTILTATLVEALAADLHVTLAVRVAVVPPLHGQHGYLLPADEGQGLQGPVPDTLVACASSSALAALGSPPPSNVARAVSSRGCSFSRRSCVSASDVILSGPSGGQPRAEGKVGWHTVCAVACMRGA